MASPTVLPTTAPARVALDEEVEDDGIGDGLEDVVFEGVALALGPASKIDFNACELQSIEPFDVLVSSAILS